MTTAVTNPARTSALFAAVGIVLSIGTACTSSETNGPDGQPSPGGPPPQEAVIDDLLDAAFSPNTDRCVTSVDENAASDCETVSQLIAESAIGINVQMRGLEIGPTPGTWNISALTTVERPQQADIPLSQTLAVHETGDTWTITNDSCTTALEQIRQTLE